MLLAWGLLIIAVLTEISWGCSLKALSYFSFNRFFIAIPIIFSLINMALLAHIMRYLPAGLTYAVWTALGTVGIIIAGIFLFNEKINVYQVFFICLCVIGVVGLKLCPQP